MRRSVSALVAAVAAVTLAVAGTGGASSRTAWDVGDVRVNDLSLTFGGPNLGWREPAIAIDPTDPQTMIAAVMNMNTYNAFGDYSEATEIYRSIDGGATWDHVKTIHEPGEDEGTWGSGDPTVVFDANGTAYVATLSDDIAFPDGPLGVYHSREGGIEVYRSDDGGATWSDRIWAVRRVIDPPNQRCSGTDKELLGVNEQTGELFLAWTMFNNKCPRDQLRYYSQLLADPFDADIMLTRSADGGTTWSEPASLWKGYALGAQPVVGPDGTIYVVFTASVPVERNACPYWLGYVTDKAPAELHLIVAISNDDGETWRYERRSMCDPELHPSEGPRLWTRIPTISVDRSDGRAYVMWSSFAANPSFAIEVMTSADGGRTWSDTRHVTEFGLEDSLQPSIHAEDGVARAIWLRTPDRGETFDVVWSESADGGVTWSTPAPINTVTFGAEGAQLGDYIWIDVAAGRVAAAWADFRSGEATDVYVRTGTAT